MDLITIIIIIAVISKLVKKAKATEDKAQPNKPNSWEQVNQQIKFGQNQNEQWQKVARENIEKAKRRATEKLREVEKVIEVEDKPQNTTVLQRAKVNSDKDKGDVTLQTMEAEHHHSERVTPAKHHNPEDVIPENVLGTVEDLMVKGYDGKLCFERDFVGEGNDMISRFTLGGI